jgi:hypothetical protein
MGFLAVKSMLKKTANDEEFYDSIAKNYKNMFNSLIKQGFNELQAMELIKNQGTNIMNTGKLIN